MHKVIVNPSLLAALCSDLTELSRNLKKQIIPCFSDFLWGSLPQTPLYFFPKVFNLKKVNLVSDICWGKKLNWKTLCRITLSLPFIFFYGINTRSRSLIGHLYNILSALRLQYKGHSASSSHSLLSWSLDVLWKRTVGQPLETAVHQSCLVDQSSLCWVSQPCGLQL